MSETRAPTIERPQAAAPESTPSSGAGHQPCQECGAPMERRQRYCVQCAARRADVSNPAARYFAASSRQRRLAAAARTSTATSPDGASQTRAAGVFFFALLPIAVAIGVIVGRSGSGPDQEQLLAAIRDGNAAGVVAGAEAAGSDATTVSNELLASDFTLDKGFTVKLELLPIDGTDEGAADAATEEAESAGAEDVGIINPGDFTTDPDQGQDSYVLYSGEFESRGEAEQALAKLKGDFPDAEVVAVASGASAQPGKTDEVGKVVAKTDHGVVHEVSTEPPSEEQVQHDTAIVNEIANQTGEDYTDLQQTLPDVTVVGGDPEDAPPLPTGAGD